MEAMIPDGPTAAGRSTLTHEAVDLAVGTRPEQRSRPPDPGRFADLDKDHLISCLPSPETKRWSSRRKAAVVVAMRSGLLSRREACVRYMLALEELAAWEAALDQNGVPGLRATRLQIYRDVALRKR
jgi:Protein of unknown function (DUF1153)